MPIFPIKREQLKPGEILCSYCTALCCRYFSVPIDTPTTRKEFDNLRWFMLHGRVTVYVEDETWYLCVYGDCQHLLSDNRCGIYETRPQICRDYSTDKCEYDDSGLHDKLFETPEQIWEYAEAIFPPKRARKDKSAKRVSLPIVS
ncbi:MAG TPA: YkgJ family cysteine cluster protein [Planctomycetaceae bacterium]|jgi:Fe-S-cluster containining protein